MADSMIPGVNPIFKNFSQNTCYQVFLCSDADYKTCCQGMSALWVASALKGVNGLGISW